MFRTRGLVDRQIDRKIFLQQLLVRAVALQLQKRAVKCVDQFLVTLAHTNTHPCADNFCILDRRARKSKTFACRLIQEAKTRGGRVQAPGDRAGNSECSVHSVMSFAEVYLLV